MAKNQRPMTYNWRERVRKLKSEVVALYLAYRDPRTPWYARIFTALVVSYALSPIDLIPDFIPILGLLDDLVLVPLGLALSIKMIPNAVIVDSRKKALEIESGDEPVSRTAAVVIILIWLLSAVILTQLGLRLFNHFTEVI
jgi:uncharacterized membrane protein YkvA (DUF1232 family)